MPEATFLVSLSMWLLQSSLLSMVTPSDFAGVTWLTWLSLIVIVGESVRVLNLYPEPISINSVLVIFRVSLFAPNQLWTLSKSRFKYNWRLSTQSPVYVRWVSSAHILSSELDKQCRNSSGLRIVPWGTPHTTTYEYIQTNANIRAINEYISCLGIHRSHTRWHEGNKQEMYHCSISFLHVSGSRFQFTNVRETGFHSVIFVAVLEYVFYKRIKGVSF